MEEALPKNTFKILVATDNHLGYGEKKPIIDQDSFRTFEEILQIARKYKVDFVLLGGDLFHEAQPSPYCLYKCTELLRKYCLGDDPVSIEFLSDQSVNFQHLRNPVVNYEDPNLNVCLPIFSIHGNHDNPAGTQQISALDILASQGLVNYFGRWTDLSEVEIKPILLKKGTSRLALYGLSHIPDQRLARLFKEQKVTMPRPQEDTWFNLLVLHQNRANRGVKNFIPASAIPKFMDLVIWGHEHDCRLKPEEEEDFYISQPGSSVATSLAEGETYEKHVGILLIHDDGFKMVEVPLKTVRPFLFSTIELINPESSEYSYTDPVQQSKNLVKEKINQMISEAAKRHTDAKSRPPLPLIRLIVKYYEDYQIFNAIRLGHEFEDKVANPADIIKLAKMKPKERSREGNVDFNEDLEDIEEWATRVEDVVQRYFENNASNRQMSILLVKAMVESVSRYVDKNDTDAVTFAYNRQKDTVREKLITKDPDEDNINECLELIMKERLDDGDKELEQLLKALDDENRVTDTAKSTKGQVIEDLNSSSSDVEIVTEEKPKRGRGSRGGRGAASTSRAPRRRASRAK